MYINGDQTNDPFMGINLSPAYPCDNPIMMFTGTDDHLYTRQVARWLDLDYITIKKKDYDTISCLSDRYIEPWLGRVMVSAI